MGGRWATATIEDGLNPNQREGARLDAMGIPAQDIAAKLDVNIATVTRWRQLPAYAVRVQALMAEQDEQVMAEIGRLRRRAMAVVHRALTHAERLLDESEDVAAADLAKVGRYALDVYRSTSAQQGIAETTRSQVEITAPEQALAQLRSELAQLPADVIDVEPE